jgi:hypothetical protein
MSQAMFDVIRGISGVLGGAKVASDENLTTPDRVVGGIGSAGSALNLFGMGLGGLGGSAASQLPALTALTGNAGAAGVLPSIGTGLLSMGAVAGAGALGYGAGKVLDWGVGKLTGKELSTHASEAMVGTVDDDIEAQGQVVQKQRGTAGIEAANREAEQRAIAYAQTFPREETERMENRRRFEESMPFGALRRAQAEAMSHWGE